MRVFLWPLVSYWIIAAPAYAADELDAVIDDLILYRTAVSAGVGSRQTAPTVFRPVSAFSVDAPQIIEIDGAVEHITTYYPVQGGPAFQVRLVFPARHDHVELTERVRELASLFREQSNRTLRTIKGHPTVTLESDSALAKTTLTALGNDSYLLVRSSHLRTIDEITSFIQALPFDGFRSLV